jgi:hypothetical protein
MGDRSDAVRGFKIEDAERAYRDFARFIVMSQPGITKPGAGQAQKKTQQNDEEKEPFGIFNGV